VHLQVNATCTSAASILALRVHTQLIAVQAPSAAHKSSLRRGTKVFAARLKRLLGLETMMTCTSETS